ncbi:Eco57I restriction-modification methylase domain-containing protein [Apilactobacillus micheneri]|uniref:Eco57I restriction-modification methylase domain-containing protein n=1 Tax=Apilactobacillus micheneri TaxID=1899430 RepID=UPI000D51C591|nr:Eco57I restriction-modification methylase domain-containing protein [Apilactobacillus micheneri]GAY79737.1 hypothetical protein NBRC113063_00601 [Apilactobacillus micheneri]
MLTENSIDNIDSLVIKMSKEKNKFQSLAISLDLADEIMKFILPEKDKYINQLNRNVQESGKSLPLISLNDFNSKQKTWFATHPKFKSSRTAFKIFFDSYSPLESNFFWFSEKTSKQKISVSTENLKNWGTSDLTRKENYKVGINFFLNDKADKLSMVISNNHKFRLLELHDHLTNTQKQIFHDRLNHVFDKDLNQSDLLQEDVHTRLWNALRLKEVNDKFYKIIAYHFHELVSSLVDSGKSYEDATQFSSRLLGRLLFSWFLRKMGVINKDIKYFNDVNKFSSSDYYEIKLKKLFFETLNTPVDLRSHGDIDTPYLNGGLFAPKINDFIDEKIIFPKDFFQRLYNHFSDFNFTIDESSTDFELIAVDPEMLGQIFESLLATEVNKDGRNERNNTGAFYTPREIVEYMVKETIRRYLYSKINSKYHTGIDKLLDYSDYEWLANKSTSKANIWGTSSFKIYPVIKQALGEFKVIDPAVGSGAFPIGMLKTLTKIYKRIQPRSDEYTLKLSILQRSIFGVDIQPMAIEIARLRAWLSVIVDEQDKKKIHPLPNLDFNFVCANTIVGLSKGQTNIFNSPTLGEDLSSLRDQYFNARSPKSKKNIQQKYYKESTSINLCEDKRSSQLKSFDPFKNNYPAKFFDSNYMFGVDKFNAVIGNPPYLQEGKVNKNNFKNIKYYKGKMDIWYSFACVGVDLLNKDGILSFIAKNNWITNNGASLLRNKIMKETKILSLIDFSNYHIFNSASIQTMIMMFSKNKISDDYTFCLKKLNKNNYNTSGLSKLLDNDKNVCEYSEPIVKRSEFVNTTFNFVNVDKKNILDKIKKNSVNLSKEEVSQGIVAPQDCLNKRSAMKLGGNHHKNEGIFVLTYDELKSLNLNSKEKHLIKPLYDSKQIKYYNTNAKSDKFIIYTDKNYKYNNSLDGLPNLKKHFDQYMPIITSENKPYGLSRSRNERIFKGEKILALRKSPNKPLFSYSNFDTYVLQTYNVIKSNEFNNKYLVSLLNSKIICFWLKYKGKMQGDNFQLDKEPLINIPIKHSPFESEIIKNFDNLINSNDKISFDESKNIIDDLIFSTYGISSDEKDIVLKDL